MTITARYSGKCAKCGQAIKPGDQINWNTETRQVSHVTCPKTVAATTAAAPAEATNAVINVHYVCRSRDGGPSVGTTVQTRTGEYATIVRKSAVWVSQDDVDDQDDFANDGNPYWSVTAYCRPATAEEAAPKIAEAQAAEARNVAKVRAQEIARMIRNAGDCPAAADDNAGGDRLLNTQNIYGGGDWFVVALDGIWYCENHGMDGDDWGRNNVRTGGAGAIGWRIPADEKLAAELRELDKVLGKKA